MFGQGLTGVLDTFLHPHYTVSVSPMDYGSDVAFISIVIGLMVFGWALHLFHQFWKARGEDDDEDDQGPP